MYKAIILVNPMSNKECGPSTIFFAVSQTLQVAMRAFAGPLIISGKGCWHCVRPLVCLIFVIIIFILTCYKNNVLTSMKLKPPGVLFFYWLKGLYYCNYSPYFKPNHYNIFINTPSVSGVVIKTPLSLINSFNDSSFSSQSFKPYNTQTNKASNLKF